MKFIDKRKPEPVPLSRYKVEAKGVNCNYEDFSCNRNFRDYRQFLLEEQGYICAYCMKSISIDNMKIEHWYPQWACKNDNDEIRTVSHKNMLAVCKGITGQISHCDTHRGELPTGLQFLTINPTDPDHNVETILGYKNGKMEAIFNQDINNNDIDNILNLNFEELIKIRITVIDGLKYALNKKYKGDWTKERLEKELEKWRSKGIDGKFSQYCQVAINYLINRIKRC